MDKRTADEMLVEASRILLESGWRVPPIGRFERDSGGCWTIVYNIPEAEITRAEIALAQLVEIYSSLDIRIEAGAEGKSLILDILDVRAEFAEFAAEYNGSNILSLDPIPSALKFSMECVEGFVITPFTGAIEYVFRFLCSTDACHALAVALDEVERAVRIQIFNLGEADALDERFRQTGWVLVVSPGAS